MSPSVLRPARQLGGELRPPADKSIAHRAMIFAALAAGKSEIRLRYAGQDVRSTIRALGELGVRMQTVESNERLTVTFPGLGDERIVGQLGPGSAGCGNSGTTMRLLAGALASGVGRSTLTGDRSLSGRPMERVAGPLRAMGAHVETTDGHAPLVVDGRRPLRALEHRLPVASAQALGAISLAALTAEGVTTVNLPGPTRDHTERMLHGMGATIGREVVEGGASVTRISGPGCLRATDVSVPGDFSSAAAWLVAASIHPDAEIRLRLVGLNPTRTALMDVLAEMGADIADEFGWEEGGEPVGDIVVRTAGRLRAVSVGPMQVPALIDELPLLAVAMAAAEGTSEVRGAAELRVKESDRIATMAKALHAAGARVEELPDGWRISRGQPREAQVITHGDHRVAMAMAVAAWSGVAAGVTLDDRECVAVSYPSFWSDAAALGTLE
ncbi:MAG TPA: 3-phosphoshikimate 1-carboxyvinyltransferase [Candidatus Limnocylindria bacterium]|nr:3-phosphoshikimate 1-carboxyvinyltransferase [Candidatus Limnocylindria bacterium]